MKLLFKTIIVYLLRIEARTVIRKYRPKVIAVTGSVGKTSTKDAIFAALAEKHFVRKSEKSYNSEIGLPLTILGVPNAWSNPLRWMQNLFDGLLLLLFRAPYPEWLVLEIGADRPGDIRSVAQWLPVDIAVITRLPEVPVHVEYFSSPEEVAEEKASIIKTLRSSGTLVLFGDDARTMELATRTNVPVITFGFSQNAGVRAERCELLSNTDAAPLGIQAVVRADNAETTLSVRGTVGQHALLPALAALAVGRGLGQDMEETVRAMERGYAPPPGRMRLLSGIKETRVIDDSYNSSPAAAEAALETLASLPKKRGARRIAVLGDMLELGKFSAEEHRKIGLLAGKKVNMLATVGFRARGIAEGALDAKLPDDKILQYEDARRAGEELAGLLRSGDIVLLKGSQSVHMERAVKALMEHPEQAGEILVRQEKEWQKRR